jgi:hypothetical protein
MQNKTFRGKEIRKMTNYAKYHVTKIEDMVTSYKNGNIADFKAWLKTTRRKNIPLAIDALNSLGDDGIDIVYRILNEVYK